VKAYREAYQHSLADPRSFWSAAAEGISWFKKPSTILDDSRPPFYRWFTDGTLNTCFNALDRQVARGRADQLALIYASPLPDTRREFSFAELTEQAAKCAGVLRALGVVAGDRVLIYLPMIPEAVIAMLACARIGAVHSVVFGGFASAELAARISDAQPKVIISASCGIEPRGIVEYQPLIRAALKRSGHQPDHHLIVARPQLVVPPSAEQPGPVEHDWKQLMTSSAIQPTECVEVRGTDPLYILYTSGTTGKPKGIVRDNGGHAVALHWSMGNVFGIGAGDVFWAASDVGWVVGHSYIVYAPLLVGATTVLYEGKPIATPDAGAFWRVAAEHRVNALFTAPTAIRAIKKEDPDAALRRGHDLSQLRALFLAGERLDPDTYHWASDHLGIPVLDNWWQTETGWPIAANLRGLEPMPVKAGSATVPVPGYDVQVLDELGKPVAAGVEGSIAIRLPLPPGALTTLWGSEQRFLDSYLSAFDGYYLTGDGGYFDSEGYLFVLGRTDDVLNVAGHRLSSGQIEAVIASHPAVAECAVIGVHDPIKGQVPFALLVTKAGVSTSAADVGVAVRQLVREQIGPIASLARVEVVAALPKTRSGKIVRKAMRELADTGRLVVPSTIEDASVLEALRDTLAPLT